MSSIVCLSYGRHSKPRIRPCLLCKRRAFLVCPSFSFSLFIPFTPLFCSNSDSLSSKFWHWVDEAQESAKDIVDKTSELSQKLASQASQLKEEWSENASVHNIETASALLLSHMGLNASDTPVADSKGFKINEEPDLSYITPRLIGMAFPVDTEHPNRRAMAGNDIRQVADFLQEQHGDKYKVWNLSEESYDYSFFGDRVVESKFVFSFLLLFFPLASYLLHLPFFSLF